MYILYSFLLAAANKCDAWSEESIKGGWSTHQVRANRELANDLRRMAAEVQKLIT